MKIIFIKKSKKIESFSVTKGYVGRINDCAGHDKLIVRQILKDMRNVLILVFLCFSLSMSGTTYYVDPSGNDSNNGSSSSPWKKLAYACSKATSSGDIIHINAGTYTETSQCNLAAGVSIEGVGASSIIKSHYTASNLDNGLIQLSGGTNTGQHISGIYLTGDGIGNSAIVVNGRSNVTILNCALTDFERQGIRFTGSSANTGNSIHDCIISGCSGYDPSYGSTTNVYLSYQTDFLFYNNTNDNTTNATNGDGLRVWDYVYGLKIYNNTLIGPEVSYNGTNYMFVIEVWGNVKSSLGYGMEIYGNTILGTVDFSTCNKGTYSFGVDYHNNIHGNSSTASIPTSPLNSNSKYLLEFEEYMDDIIIRNNTFRNTDRPIYFDSNGTVGGVNNVKIYSNLFQNIYSNYQSQPVDGGIYVGQGCGILFGGSVSPLAQSNIYIQNNTFVAWTGSIGAAQLGILLPTSNTCSNIYIQNNIFKGFSVAPYAAYAFGTGSLSYLYLQKNIVYGNGNSNNLLTSGITVGNKTDDGGIKSDPLFISSTDFHLQTGSPAIGTGVSISGLTTDYAGNTIKNPPSIGAFESTGSAPPPVAVAPVYQSSVVQNATPSVLEMTFDLTLNNAVLPAASSFTVLVNTVVRTVSSVAISGNKVQLTLASAIKFGDVVTIAYTKPAANQIQSTAGGQTINITAQPVINSIIIAAKDAPVTVNMTISPSHIHRIINVLLAYSSSLTSQIALITPEIIRITDLSGRLFVEKLIVTGITNFKIPLNLNSGIYNVQLTGNGSAMATQKIIVY